MTGVADEGARAGNVARTNATDLWIEKPVATLPA